MKKLETLFLLKDPAALARFDLLAHASEMMSMIDSEQSKRNLKGIKLTVTAYCEPKVELTNGSYWKTVRFAVRLLRSHRSKKHLNISLVVNRNTHMTTATCDAVMERMVMIYVNQDENNDAFAKIAEYIVSLLTRD